MAKCSTSCVVLHLKFYFIYHLDGKNVFFRIHSFTLVAGVGVSRKLNPQ